MEKMYLKFFSLVFLGLCFSGLTGSAVSEKELEALRILGPLAVATEDFGGDFGDTEEAEDTDGNTEETDEDTKNKDGDTDDTDGDTEDANGDAEDANGDTKDTDDDNEDTDGETEEDTRDIAADTQTIGDADGTDIGTEETDTKHIDVETEDTDEDTRDTDGYGDTTDTDGDTETTGDADGTDIGTEGTDTDTDGETEYIIGDTDGLAFHSRRQNSDPCNSYTILNEAWRSVNNNVRSQSCDRGFRGEWYRFINPAGTSMPTQRPQSTHRCGTHAPMWMNGQHPSVADGEVSRQACAYWSGRPCRWSTTIQVKACSAGYYVYKLPRVNHCYLGYCGASVDSALTTSAPAAGTTKYADTTAKPTPQTTASSVVPGEKIIFPGPRDVDDYARMESTLSGDLTSFTLCVHMRSNMASSNQISLVSYAVSGHHNELLLFVQGGFHLYIQSNIRMADPPVWDGEWHTVCTTWRSSDGAWQLYVDGDLTASGSGFRVGGRVRRGGTWILGQDQDRVGGGFEASQSFIGKMSEVNLWDRVLSPAEIAADCSYHGNVIDWDTTNIRVFGEASRADYHRCARAPVSELSASTTCSNDYMELSIPEDQLTDIDLNNLHWRPDRNCGATTNGSHYLFRTELYDCGTEVTFGAKYVTFLNTINILGTHLNSGVITREGDIWITSKCNYERKEWVDSTFLPIPGGLNFTEEGFGQLEVRLSMFPTRQYLRQYRADQYPIHLRLRQHVYMQLEVQGHAQKLSVLALNCKATMSPSPNDSLQYQLIREGCASDPTLKTYDVDDPGKERFGFEAFRFIREVRTVYVHCEVLVCDAADAGSRCAQGCVRRGKRAAGEVDMRGRHMIYQGPIVLDDDKEAEHAVRLVDDQETGPARRGAPWAMLAAGCVLAALALAVLGAAIVQKRSRRGEWAYHGLKDGE
ncbi:oncoprotein-induced transcript 3 protein-like isoform X2 [Branchiostoma floridae x Branchiostoma belcheri]